VAPLRKSTLPILSELCEPGEPGGCRVLARRRRGRNAGSLHV